LLPALRRADGRHLRAASRRAKDAKRTPRRIPGTVLELIETGLLAAGTTLRPARRTVDAQARVAADGTIVLNGVAHKTPSAAAKAASGQQAEAGWDFWVIDDERAGRWQLAAGH